MKKLLITTSAVGLLLALVEPSLAASRAPSNAEAYSAYASGSDRSGAYYYGPQGAYAGTTVQPQAAPSQVQRSQGLPYPDRPYGDPDRW